jgi:Tol biopolymer transport system component
MIAKSSHKATALASLLFALYTVFAFSCAREQLTVTGAERLFGKNKVSDTSYCWKEIQGNHFRVIYPQSLRKRALHIARIYTRNLGRICRDIGIPLDDPIPVFIYPSQEEYETTHIISSLVEGSGGFTELYKTRVVFPVHGSNRELEHLALHEITHAVQLRYLLQGPYRSWQIFLTGVLSPLWLLEGIAEYESAAWDSMARMYVRDAVMDHKLIPLNQLRGFSHLPSHQIQLAYHQSDLFIQFLAETYGPQCIAHILKLSKNKLNIHNILHEVTGLRILPLEWKWQEYAEGRLGVEGEGLQDPFAQAQLHTDNKGWNLFPCYSPDGSRIAFLSDWENEASYFSLYILDLATGSLRRIKEDGLEHSSISWSHDGKHLVLVSDEKNRSDLFIFHLEESKLERIQQKCRNNRQPFFLPGDKEVGFVATVNGIADIYKIRLADRKVSRLTHTPNNESNPCWSADGRFLVFSREYLGQYDLVIKDLKGGEQTRLTHTPSDELSPVFIPGSQALIYISDQGGIFNLYRYDLQTGMSWPLSRVIGGIFTPQVSKDGHRVLFSYFRHGQYRIFESPLLKKLSGT